MKVREKEKREPFHRARGDRSEKVRGNVSHGGCFRRHKRSGGCVVFGAEPRHVVDTSRNRCTNLPRFLPFNPIEPSPIRFPPAFLYVGTISFVSFLLFLYEKLRTVDFNGHPKRCIWHTLCDPKRRCFLLRSYFRRNCTGRRTSKIQINLNSGCIHTGSYESLGRAIDML